MEHGIELCLKRARELRRQSEALAGLFHSVTQALAQGHPLPPDTMLQLQAHSAACDALTQQAREALSAVGIELAVDTSRSLGRICEQLEAALEAMRKPEAPAVEASVASETVADAPVHPAHPDDSPPDDIAPHLRSFAAFAEGYWQAPGGACEPVPWVDEGFEKKLRQATMDALVFASRQDRPDLAPLYVLCRAAEELGSAALVHSEDVLAAGSILARPHSMRMVHSADRGHHVRAAMNDRTLSPFPEWKLRVFLEAVAPAPDDYFYDEEITKILETVSYSSPAIRNLVFGLLRLKRNSTTPIGRVLRGPAGNPKLTLEQVRRALSRRREELYDYFIRHQLACGGRIFPPHCVRAWTQFIERIRDQVTQLFPIERKGQAAWKPELAARWIDEFASLHQEFADAAGAKHIDRARMDETAHTIARLSADVNEAMAQVLSFQAGKQALDPLLKEALLQLLDSPGLSDATEELLRRLLVSLVGVERAADKDEDEEDGARGAGRAPLALNVRQICRHPDLMSYGQDLRLETIDDPPEWPAINVERVTDVVRAAAVLISAPTGPKIAADDSRPLRLLQRHLQERQRLDLLAALAAARNAPGIGQAIQDVATHWRDRIFTALFFVEGELSRLDAMAELVAAQSLRAAIDLAKRMVDPPADCPWRPAMLLEWLTQLQADAARVRSRAAEALAEEVEQHADAALRPHLQQLLKEERYMDVLRLLHRRGSGAPAYRVRETMWRGEAAGQWRDPVGEAEATIVNERSQWRAPRRPAGGEPGAETEPATGLDLLSSWRGRRGPHVAHDPVLVRRFTDLILPPEALETAKERVPHRVCDLAAALADITRSGLNPCYLPQLRRFGRLVVMVASAPVDSLDFPFHVAREIGAMREKNDLFLVLAPRIPAHIRAQTLRGFLKIDAALVDDLDFCRLVHCTRRLIGLFEIIFEQLNWEHLSPFELPDGQHVTLEMFTGRETEAMHLATGQRYSLIYSGRMLGKSALLKSVELRYDGTPLASGLKLRVLFVSAVGADEERHLVSTILETMEDKFDFRPDLSGVPESPGDRLLSALRQYLKEHPDESLLIVLDEADSFVKEQISTIVDQQKLLSFRMSRAIEGLDADAHRLPRIRFAFSGYQVTNQRRGVWLHWRDVLTLDPLRPEEAERLIGGPLARVGIDCTAMAAAIAYRCGYQPAPILRFGDRLLKLLRENYASYQREQVRVTLDHVVQVFNSPEVRDEITRVVLRNFEGDPGAAVIFNAMVGEFAPRPHGLIADLTARILARLRRIGPDLTWLEDQGEAPARIEHCINDMVDRKLLIRQTRDGEIVGYRMTYPHHLMLLARPDQDESIRKQIRGIKLTSTDAAAKEKSLLSEADLLTVGALVTQQADPPRARSVVVASQWGLATYHRRGGVPARVGLWNEEIKPAGRWEDSFAQARRLCVHSVGPELAARIVAARDPKLPPVLLAGGTDLLRWAIGRHLDGDVIEIRSIRRLTPGRVAWWFRLVRGVQFDLPDAMDRIYRLTSGIPLLVGRIEQLLAGDDPDRGGFNVTADQFEQAAGHFENLLPAVALDLITPGSRLHLLPREIELLRVFRAVSQYLEEDSPPDFIQEAMSDAWDAVVRSSGLDPAIAPLGPGDTAALWLLQDLGLLRVADGLAPRDRLAVLQKEGAAWRLIELIEKALQTRGPLP